MTIAELTKSIRLRIATAIPANLATASGTKASKIAEIANLAVANSGEQTIKWTENSNCLGMNYQQLNQLKKPESNILKTICKCGYRPPFCSCGFWKFQG